MEIPVNFSRLEEIQIFLGTSSSNVVRPWGGHSQSWPNRWEVQALERYLKDTLQKTNIAMENGTLYLIYFTR